MSIDLLDLLEQDEVWPDGPGKTIPIIEMDPERRDRAIAYLHKHMEPLTAMRARQMSSMTMPSGEQAYYEVEAAVEAELTAMLDDPVAWLMQQPVMGALQRGYGGKVWKLRRTPDGCAECGTWPKEGHTSTGHDFVSPSPYLLAARWKALADDAALEEQQAPEEQEEPDFFEPGYTYLHPITSFRCETLVTHPETGERAALGWMWVDRSWRPVSFNQAAFGDWTGRQKTV